MDFSPMDDFEDVGTNLRTLQEAISSLQTKLESLTERMDTVETDSADQDITRISSTLRRLTERVTTLEQRGLPRTGAIADFDTWSETERDLADDAEHAITLRRELLPTATVRHHQRRIAAFEQATAERQVYERAVVNTAREIAELPDDRDPRQPAHQQARQHYTSAVEALRSFPRGDDPDEIERLRRTVESNTKLRAQHGADITRGVHAWTQLRSLLWSRLEEAITTGATAPVWFTTVLGATPPAHDTEGWMNTAVLLLAFRLTYHITDPVVALGPTPSSNTSARQRSLYRQLTADLEKHHP